MDIRTKLIFALVAVSLASMLALGVLMYMSADEALRLSRLEQLDGLAESEKDAVQQVVAGWEDRVSLMASRVQLRQSLADHAATGSPDAVEALERILRDTRRSVRIVETLAVYDPDGQLLAWAGPQGETEPPARGELTDSMPSPGAPEMGVAAIRYAGMSVAGAQGHRVGFEADLVMDGRELGTLGVHLNTRALEDLIRDRTGLGQSGETQLLIRDVHGRVHVLRPIDQGQVEPGAEPESAHADILADDHPEDRAGSLVPLALDGGEDGTYWRNVTDDRGVPVWAAVRHLPRTGWGVVVKVDAREARERVLAFREHMGELATALGGFAILLGTFLGFRFAGPVQDLAKVARRIGEGDLSARAQVVAHDEVGLLARTMNRMAEELEDQVTLLKEFERFFEVSLDLMCIAGVDGYFKRVNPAFVETLGWSMEELTNQPFVDLVHPDDREATHAEIDKLSRGIPTISFENRFRTEDGDYRHLLWTSYPDPETGRLYAIARDITDLDRERREAAERIETLERRLAQAQGSGDDGGGDRDS